jgi:hypothetical protein
MEEKDVLRLPARGIPVERLIFDAPNLWAYNLKIILREACKNLPEYWIPIEIEPKVTGLSPDGKQIPINTLGRWIFGTPGYKGNCNFLGGEKQITIQFPSGLPGEALEMFKKAVEKLKEERR